jgi:hypothetical protein
MQVPRDLLNIDNNSAWRLTTCNHHSILIMRFDDYPCEKHMDVLEIVLENI